uniref:SH3 domain-containing protein n=1 Tax=Neoroseomonas rubea TaxID=2748666 RepID=UPI0018DF31DF
LEALRTAAAADAALAQEIAARIAARDAELAPAMESLAPGARTEGADTAPPIESTTPLPLPLRARPDATSVRVATLPAGTQVALRPSRDPDFVAVERPGGMRLGYVPASSFGAAAPARRVPRADEPLRFLAATNVARRDNFAETVGDLTRAGQGQGFEPAQP